MKRRKSRPFKIKGKVSIMEATRQAYKKMPIKFYGSQLADKVRKITGRREVYADTVLRKMRLLKQRGEVDYSCVDSVDSYYMKMKDW